MLPPYLVRYAGKKVYCYSYDDAYDKWIRLVMIGTRPCELIRVSDNAIMHTNDKRGA